MTVSEDSHDLSLDDQRLLLAIRSSKEKNEDGYQQADFSQLRQWLDWSRNRMDSRFDSLDERGLISISYRSPDEMETNRTPPRIARLTGEAVGLIQTGALKDAMFERVSETADPQTYDEIFERLEAVESLVESYRTESVTYYEKWSSILTELRERAGNHDEDLDGVESKISRLTSQVSTVYATLYEDDSVSRDYTGLNSAVDELISDVYSLHQAIARQESQVVELKEAIQDEKRTDQSIRERLERLEGYLQANGHRLRSEKFEVDEETLES